MGAFADNPLSVFLIQQQAKLDTDQIWLRIVDTDEIKDFIVELNTESQLFEKGIDSNGVTLKEIGGNESTPSGYSPVTIEIKRRKGGKGGKISNITLYDEGDYYESHIVTVTTSGFEIDADPIKEDTNLFVEWGEDIVGLTDESLQKLIDLLLIKYINYTREVIFGR